ncbi:MAG TPA: cupin domain-containing protein [Steroidobacteraceae bacterium]|jgi:mannose-6-phosphate isomerase-like protein (cupin superfamily)
MKIKRLNLRAGFHIAVTHRRAQAATMTLAPGASEGGPHNRHRGADQWLYVIEGSGRATLNGRKLPLEPGTILLIERGDLHEIRNTGRRLLKTLNIYIPPAYRADGEELPRAKS